MIKTKLVCEQTITGPARYYPLLRKYATRRTEHFIVTTLNAVNKPIHTYIATQGLVNRTMVHPREVFWFAIKDMACGIIIAHNHPSGDLEPSFEDREITKRLEEAGEILGIPVLDHIILGKTGYYSLVEHGLIEPKL